MSTPSQSDYAIWSEDYETGTKNLKGIQDTITKAKPNAPRQHFLDFKTSGLPTVRFTHALWERKSTQDDENSESDTRPEDDLDASDNELIKTMQNKDVARVKATTKYGSAVPPKLKSFFKETAQNYDIKQPKFFRVKNGVDISIPPALYQTRLENAIVEITFNPRHYYLTHQKIHSFTALIQSLRVLSSVEILSAPAQQTLPKKRKSYSTNDDDDDEQSPPKKGKMKEHDAKENDPGSSTTDDDDKEQSTHNEKEVHDTLSPPDAEDRNES